MPIQSRRLTWRLAKNHIDKYTRGRELWLHRPGDNPVHVGGVSYDFTSPRGNWWRWYTVQDPVQGYLHGCWMGAHRWGSIEEAQAGLLKQTDVKHWPVRRCQFCTLLGCTECK